MQVEIEDFSAELREMNATLELDPAETAVVTIDMHRGHLDPELATMPCDPEAQRRVVDAAAFVLTAAQPGRVASDRGDPGVVR